MDEKLIGVPPHSVSELLERLDALTETLPKRLRQCSEFTRRHLHLIAVSTVSDMASAANVAPSVYMRFCQALGFKGYSEMQALFRARFTEFRPNYEERLAGLSAVGDMSPNHLLAEFAESGHGSLLSLANTVSTGALDRTAAGLAEAQTLHLVGMKRAFPVVSTMAYMLEQLGARAVLHAQLGMLEASSLFGPNDALFAVTYTPFTGETIELAQSAASRGTRVFGLSDSEKCPLVDFADDVLIAREDEVAGFRALNASITLATTLVVAMGALRNQS